MMGWDDEKDFFLCMHPDCSVLCSGVDSAQPLLSNVVDTLDPQPGTAYLYLPMLQNPERRVLRCKQDRVREPCCAGERH